MKNKKNYPFEIFFNDQWIKPEEAFVSVFDRSFMFGDAIYEVTPIYSGKVFRLQEHGTHFSPARCSNEYSLKS